MAADFKHPHIIERTPCAPLLVVVVTVKEYSGQGTARRLDFLIGSDESENGRTPAFDFAIWTEAGLRQLRAAVDEALS